MVIILVLGILVLLVALGAPLTDASVALDQQQRITFARESNYQMARSAVELAMTLLGADDTDYDSGQDIWAFGNQKLTWEGKNMWLEIRDEDSRFPLSSVTNVTVPGGALANTTTNSTTNTTTNSTSTTTSNTSNLVGLNSTTSADSDFYTKALQRLVERAGLPPKEAVAALQDWVDTDDEIRDGGAEQGSYPTLRIKNGPLDSVEEVYLIARWGPPTLPPPESLQPGTETLAQASKMKASFAGQPAAPGVTQQVQTLSGGSDWSDWLTLWSAGKVNLNTAPREVLRCLDAGMTDAILESFIAARQGKVFKTQEDLKKIPGIDADLAFRLSKVAGYKSRYFRIRVVVDDEPGRVALEAVVQRSDNKVMKVVYWRLF